MIDYQTKDVLEVFAACENVNAALKNFVKREVTKGDPGGKIAKNLKAVLDSNDNDRIEGFLAKHREENGGYLLAIGGYAHLEFISIISEAIVDNYAEAFNETYESDGTECNITDEKEFNKIAKQALNEIDEAIDNAELPKNPFMKSVVYNAIFEDAVFEKVKELL